MRVPLGLARAQRQQRRRAIECLDLRLLVHAEDQRARGGLEVEPNDIAHFIDEERVGGELERLLAMGLQPVRVPDADDRGLRDTGRLRHQARAPVRGLGRGRPFLEGLPNDALDVAIGDRARRARARGVEQPIQSLPEKARAPLAHRAARHAHRGGDIGARRAARRREDDRRAFRQRARGLRAATPRGQLREFGIRQHQRSQQRAARHGDNLSSKLPHA